MAADTAPRHSRSDSLVAALGFALCVLALLWAADLVPTLGLEIYTEQFIAAMLALALTLVFLRQPLRGTRPGPIDFALSALGFVAGAYLTWRFPVLLNEAFFRPTESLILGAILVALVIEGVRRAAGWSLIVVFLVLAVYALIGHLVPGKLQSKEIPLDRLISYLGIDTGALLGAPLIIACTVVIAYVFLGNLLMHSGGSAFFTDIAAALMGRYRGGPAKIAVVASGLFGTISGSAVSNVASVGVITIPLMKQAGYRPHIAAAIEAVASTGGQVMPPIMGAAAFLMAEFLQVSYGEVVLAAIVPALLYYASVFVQADLEAARRNIRRVDIANLPRPLRVLRQGGFLMVPFGVLIFALFNLNAPAETAALWACGALAVLGALIGYGGKRLTLSGLLQSVVGAGLGVVDIILICGVAGMIIGLLNLTGLAFALSLVMLQFGQGSLFLLLIAVAVICVVLGMGMPTTGVYLLVATLAAPPMIQLGVPPMAAHMFVFYFGMLSMITPPVALAAFTAANLAGAPPMRVGVAACALGWPAFVVPFMFAYSPTLLLVGAPGDVALALVTAVAGVWLTSAGIAGYFLDHLTPPLRLAFVVAGIALLIPATAFPGAIYTDIGGAALGAALILREWTKRRRSVIVQQSAE